MSSDRLTTDNDKKTVAYDWKGCKGSDSGKKDSMRVLATARPRDHPDQRGGTRGHTFAFVPRHLQRLRQQQQHCPCITRSSGCPAAPLCSHRLYQYVFLGRYGHLEARTWVSTGDHSQPPGLCGEASARGHLCKYFQDVSCCYLMTPSYIFGRSDPCQFFWRCIYTSVHMLPCINNCH